MHIGLSPPCQEDIVTTIATTTTSIPQLNSTTTIDIHELTPLCETFVKNESSVHDTAAYTVIIDMDEDDEAVASSVTALLSSNDEVILGMQNQSQ